MSRFTRKQEIAIGSVAAVLVIGGLGVGGAISDNPPKPRSEATLDPSVVSPEVETPSESESETEEPSEKASKRVKVPSRPSPSDSLAYDGQRPVPTDSAKPDKPTKPAKPSSKPSVKPSPTVIGGLTEMVKGLKTGDENNAGYAREKFGYQAPTPSTRETLIEQEMRPNHTWYSVWDGFLYEGTSGLDADHTVALAEAWGSGARNWSEAKRIKFANDLTSPYTLNLITSSLNRGPKSDNDPFDWVPSVNQCEYIKQWTSVKLRWQLTADGEEKMALHNYAVTCDKG